MSFAQRIRTVFVLSCEVTIQLLILSCHLARTTFTVTPRQSTFSGVGDVNACPQPPSSQFSSFTVLQSKESYECKPSTRSSPESPQKTFQRERSKKRCGGCTPWRETGERQQTKSMYKTDILPKEKVKWIQWTPSLGVPRSYPVPTDGTNSQFWSSGATSSETTQFADDPFQVTRPTHYHGFLHAPVKDWPSKPLEHQGDKAGASWPV